MSLIDTIVAPATPYGESALAVVRVSGPLCAELANSCLGAGVAETPRKAFVRNYKALDGNVLDNCLAVFFAGKRSYTGEPLLELSLHGNPLIVQRVTEDLLARGCRMAEPGEFTRTAFLNGKLDLSQAEAVTDLISARSEQALQVAQRQLDGSIGRKMAELTDRLLGIIASVEAYIDFPEEDLPPEDQAGPAAELAALSRELSELIETSHYKTLLHEGIRTVIMGEPNAGKSSLLNALMGEDRAIVSAEPGTTRDFLTERVMIGSYGLQLVDTAGIRESDADIERQGIERTLKQVKDADFLLVVVDQAALPPHFPKVVEERLAQHRVLVVENKIDLPPHPAFHDVLPGHPRVRISLAKGDGLPELRAKIQETLEADRVVPAADELMVSARHADALARARASVDEARVGLRDGIAEELAAAGLRDALAAFGEVIGKIDNEDMLDKLFANFCIGK
ncbi:tRNA uridine-5-carboxymethylaminomethyl(34) synthesis GTPase MnmE [Cerasicoccus fimbriatus]|uniref:tRNA uridine-5-carboxymethylaminomethyl(34) synthesis GTPase MnmE n=1 Tax=Cerasicoccus fimbriatus TaxID=3014554 RepID=UPI0022B4F05C|nr:tRNA uridine-5-carboxymethylaminomethyl(34) synthesis GTPase MnmE [Cerasicoccus sp. TK19100]